uniref:VASt domain-containing protein n=2 Tax=Kalanchoe fedtschenkoi TaxID=63787 RepID=A0A7N0V7A5_KALFE
MAVEASPSREKVIAAPQSQTMESSPARRPSDAASVAAVAAPDSESSFGSNDGSERQYSSPRNYRRNLDSQSPAVMKSEEYRQLFRLPLDEFLIQDFNCALQESFLIQGHLYVFHRYICFYSNIFGFETKKTISLEEITCIRRAKAAGIFPTAIEIDTGDRKLFFTSFLSRDEAFNLLNDLWLQHGTAAVLAGDQPALLSSLSNQSIQSLGIENVGNSDSSIDYDVRETDGPNSTVLEHPSNAKDVGAPKATSEQQKNVVEEPEAVLPITMFEPQNNIAEEAQSVFPATISDPLRNVDQKAISCQPETSSGRTLNWKEEDVEAPKTPECYTKVAETIFPIQVEDFFSFFLSDDAVSFVETFHTSCGDKDFKCTLWRPQDEYGQTRQASFLHPIKFYLGAKLGCCQETQTFRVYKNSHLIMETSHEISDVPYGDHFIVKALWDVEKRDGDGFEKLCVLRIYVYVAFSKKTMWKGKIEQSATAGCREVYSSWIMHAHKFLKQKNIENKDQDVAPSTLPSLDDIQPLPVKQESVEVQENSEAISNPEIQLPNGSGDMNVPRSVSAPLKSQSYLGLLLLATVTVLLLMQFTVVILLARSSQAHTARIVHKPLATGDGSPEALAWLEKRFHHLKDEMLMFESRLERMRREYTLLKSQLDAYKK